MIVETENLDLPVTVNRVRKHRNKTLTLPLVFIVLVKNFGDKWRKQFKFSVLSWGCVLAKGRTGCIFLSLNTAECLHL